MNEIERLPPVEAPVDPASVEARLLEIAQAGIEGSERVLIRTLNLIAVASDEEEAERARITAAELPVCHPARCLILEAFPSREGSGFRAEVSASCFIAPGGGRRVCSEEIVLKGGGGSESQMISAVNGLLAPDLPAFLWLPPRVRLQSQLFRSLIRSVDRLIVDSRELSDRLPLLQRVIDLCLGHQVVPGDLNWTALSDWRAMTAQFFDGAACLACLPRIDAVEIEYAGDSVASQALLLAGWLASRLAWRPLRGEKSRSSLRARYVSGDHEIEMTLASGGPADAPAGAVTSLRLEASSEPSGRFELRYVDTGCIEATGEIGGEIVQARRVEFRYPSQTELVCSQLDVLGSDPAFEQAVASAIALVRAAS